MVDEFVPRRVEDLMYALEKRRKQRQQLVQSMEAQCLFRFPVHVTKGLGEQRTYVAV